MAGRQTNTSLPRASSSMQSDKNRHLTHLHSQLAQLAANLADLENQVKITAVQAQAMRDLGGYCGGMFMAASKILGEEMITGGPASNESANNKNQAEEDEKEE